MGKAIEDLRHEHEAIRFALSILESIAARAEAESALPGGVSRSSPDYADARTLLAFLREFADRCHHGKEEGILFPEMEKAGVAREGGPIGQMLAEHDEGRAMIGAMVSALDAGEPGAFARGARAYAALLRAHIVKENDILFPMGERALDPGTLKSIMERFDEHEAKVIGAGRHEQLHAMLEEFGRKYPASA